MSNQIVEMLVSGKKDLTWFQSNLDRLILEYNNRFIAFRDEQIIDSDTDLESLMAKLKKKRVDISNVFIEFVSKVKFIL